MSCNALEGRKIPQRRGSNISPPQKHFIYPDYLTWDAQGHIELIENTPVRISPLLRALESEQRDFSVKLQIIWMEKCDSHAVPFAVRHLRVG